MNTKYKILFAIDLLHDYYSNMKCNDITCTPTAETSALLKAGLMLCKMVGNKLVILIKVNDDATPYVTLSEAMKLRFYLQINNPNFTTISQLGLSALSSKKLYFSNLSGNESDGTLFLSQPHPAHNIATAYAKGDIVQKGNDVFECINTPTATHDTSDTAFWVARPTIPVFDLTATYKTGNMVKKDGHIYECLKDGTTGKAVTEAAYWHNHGTVQYVTNNDTLAITAAVKNFTLAVASDAFVIKVYGLNTGTNVYDREVWSEVQTKDQPTTEVQVDLRTLPPAKYIVNINTQEFPLYVDSDAVYNSVLGIVEVFNHLPSSDDFALLNPDNTVKEFTYKLRFGNRLAQWKYLTTKRGVKNITDSSAAYSFTQTPASPEKADYFLSDKPIPLTQSPRLFTVELTTPLSEPPSAPNPNPGDGAMLIRDSGQDICKIYLNY